MDFSKLNSQYQSFWKTHNLNDALSLLSSLRSYWGEDFSNYPTDLILEPDKLLISYAGRHNLNIANIDINKITYSFLLNDFANYWNEQAKNISDEKKRLQAISDTTKFSSLFSGIDFSNIGNFVKSNLLIIVIGLGVVLSIVVFIKK